MKFVREVEKEIPAHLKYYLLDFKDRCDRQYMREFGGVSMKDLSLDDFKRLIVLAFEEELKMINSLRESQ